MKIWQKKCNNNYLKIQKKSEREKEKKWENGKKEKKQTNIKYKNILQEWEDGGVKRDKEREKERNNDWSEIGVEDLCWTLLFQKYSTIFLSPEEVEGERKRHWRYFRSNLNDNRWERQTISMLFTSHRF